MSKKHHNLSKDQSGLVSFMVVMIIMFVLALIVFAFGRLVRREQTQTLDRQLNSQAFYAAESGVNDALNALANGTVTGFNDECDGPGSFIAVAGLNNDLGNGVSYSCLLVDNAPNELVYDNISDSSTVVPLEPEGGSPISSVQIFWDDTTTASPTLSGCPVAGSYPATWSASCQIGLMRLELAPFSEPASPNPTRDQLITNRGITFVSPRTSGTLNTSITLATINNNNQGRPLAGNCTGTTPRRCSLTITGLNMTLGYLRLRSIYRASGVTIRAFTGGTPLTGTRVGLVGAQAEIDATGRVSGVIKRIKVAAPIPANPGDPLPEYALQTSRTQCKRIIWRPGLTSADWLPGTDFNYCNPLLP